MSTSSDGGAITRLLHLGLKTASHASDPAPIGDWRLFGSHGEVGTMVGSRSQLGWSWVDTLHDIRRQPQPQQQLRSVVQNHLTMNG